ncbi:hypothetical protein EN814_18930 [Mesorhizobium sp. M2D.F.Ca.ET.171.01.1.1]|uniref:hypothetical protein n=1 Tax=unclassified Mesorhizobium TaxID=325217 RepID=UPI001091B898|nr:MULTISPECIES: hypothetical protein [unclassified Mesorhizobium]TGS94778.1 hypothetical protein EN821_18945 [Mesorhizobium sp. M2D.F.Ca.ET.178.01.1.1]TGT10560.1 hypothetical protein EN814_18930 [Mesorhizobium sp. M2D.F.Ca.ET.171.01.1.1]
MNELEELRAALAVHKAEITNAHAEYFAVQAILGGLLLQLDRKMVENAFEYAAQTAMTASDATGSTQPTRSLQIIDQLRSVLLG